MKTKYPKFLFFLILFFLFGKSVSAQLNSFKTLLAEIQQIQTQFAPDKRTAIFNAEISDTISRPVVLRGKTNLQEGKARILDLLRQQGLSFIDSVKVLPATELGDRIWGIATLSVSNLRALPGHASEMVSQVLMGTPLKILEYKSGWYRVQAPDTYIGWMEGSGLVRKTVDEMDQWKNSKRYIYRPISGNVFAGKKRSREVVSDLIMGNLLEVDAEVKGYLKIRLPDGRTGFVKKSECISWEEFNSRKPQAQEIIQIAKQLMGVPYLWGGTSSKSVDCSGLIKTAYFSQGIILARDASQQALYGDHPDINDLHTFEPGDLLFFGKDIQRITHVGLYMGDGKFIHASGLVRVNSLDRNDPAYSPSARESLVSGSRILNSLQTEGIHLLKDHPWYSTNNQQN